jgi:hypothetical protein
MKLPLIDKLIMMGWDYDSEPRPPTGLFFMESHGDDDDDDDSGWV